MRSHGAALAGPGRTAGRARLANLNHMQPAGPGPEERTSRSDEPSRRSPVRTVRNHTAVTARDVIVPHERAAASSKRADTPRGVAVRPVTQEPVRRIALTRTKGRERRERRERRRRRERSEREEGR